MHIYVFAVTHLLPQFLLYEASNPTLPTKIPSGALMINSLALVAIALGWARDIDTGMRRQEPDGPMAHALLNWLI